MGYVRQFEIPENSRGGGEDITVGILIGMLDSIVDGKVIQTAEDYYSYVNYMKATQTVLDKLDGNAAAYEANYSKKLVNMIETLGREVKKSIEQADTDQCLYMNVAKQASLRRGQLAEYAAHNEGTDTHRSSGIVAYLAADLPVDMMFLLSRCEQIAAKDHKKICVMPLWLKNCLESTRDLRAVQAPYVWGSAEIFIKDIPHLETSLTLWEPGNAGSAFVNYEEALKAARIL